MKNLSIIFKELFCRHDYVKTFLTFDEYKHFTRGIRGRLDYNLRKCTKCGKSNFDKVTEGLTTSGKNYLRNLANSQPRKVMNKWLTKPEVKYII